MISAKRFTNLGEESGTADLPDGLFNGKVNEHILWLTVRAEVGGEVRWMGASLPGANQLTLHVEYGDLAGEAAGLAIWQNGQPIRHLDYPSNGGIWTVTLPAST